MKSIFKIIIFSFLFVNFAYCATYLPVGSEASFTFYEIPLKTEGKKEGVYFVLGDKFFPLESSYPHDTYSTYEDCSPSYSRYSSLDGKAVVSFYLGSFSIINNYEVDPTIVDYNCKDQFVKTPAIKVHTSYHSTSGYYSCPNGGTFDPNTRTCKTCNKGDKLNSDGMCYTDCTKYDFKNGVIKIGFSDGSCADCSTSKNYNDLYKCLCNFSGSSFSNSGAFVGDNKGSIYANCDNATQIKTPDNIFDDKPTEPTNPDKPTNPGSGSSGSDITDPKPIPGGSDITDPKPVPGGSGSVTTDPGNKPDSSDPKPDDKPKDSNNNPGGSSPSAGDSELEYDTSGIESVIDDFGKTSDKVVDLFNGAVYNWSSVYSTFESSVGGSIDKIKNNTFKPLKSSNSKSCPKIINMGSSSVEIDICKNISPASGIVYTFTFITFLGVSVVFFIKIIILLFATF
ncbi:Uncharacterised protein [Campylobacter hyointestinalis subsp. hyointestinalis]|uniref:Uncharacterized protein n=1 Tax=Campylobacter hyointestinalis subsp. hyointestinalis TaxID=91352 RepID=A0A0S4RC46_CAMHY|nr:hypothetical protein [Campylobacter hyointestinalis]CUU71439.1 Uncharacterised protein [Campylobacter hyointestinalis subsp. hyointestinalis]